MKKTKDTLHDEITPTESAVGTLILICKACGERLSHDENPAAQLRKNLKSELKENHRKGEAKAVLVSCMSLCPKNKIAVSVASVGEPMRTFELDPELVDRDPEDILDILL